MHYISVPGFCPTQKHFTKFRYSALPNLNQLRESTTPIEEPIKATMRFGDKRDDQPNGKVNVKKKGGLQDCNRMLWLPNHT